MDVSKFTKISFPAFGLELDPIKEFAIGSMNVRMYGIVIAVGLLLAVIYGLKRSKHFGLKEDDILDGVLGIVPFAIICARAYYCAFSWENYAANPISVFNIREGGLAIYGGIIGGVIAAFIVCKVEKLNFYNLLDLIGMSLLIGQGIGRWGNYANQEAFGTFTNGNFGMMSKKVAAYIASHPDKFGLEGT